MRVRLLVTIAILAFILPAAAPAQQRAKVPKVGVLLVTDLDFVQPLFRQGLREVGLIEGQNVHVEYRSAVGHVDRLDALAMELVGLKVDVIVTQATSGALAAKRATTVIPIVISAAGDPVGSGLVASLARPGGNVTGVTGMSADLGGKLVELLKEVRPSIGTVAVLVLKDETFGRLFVEHIESAARRVGVKVRAIVTDDGEGLDDAFATISKDRPGALIILPILATRRAADLARKHRLVSITSGVRSRAFPEVGGLMSYGGSSQEYYRRAAVYVNKILKGARPADLPVEQPTTFELVINLKTAQAIGVTIPDSVVRRADHLIQ